MTKLPYVAPAEPGRTTDDWEVPRSNWRWRSVKDEMPEKGQWCLVAAYDQADDMIHVEIARLAGLHPWWEVKNDFMTLDLAWVRFWMPMPELPEVKE